MALSRALFNEFRPLFRMLEDPFAVDPALSALSSRQRSYDPFSWQSTSPALNLSEESDKYIVEAELPGVRKENLDLRVGDGGRSLTIEGRIVRGGGDQQQQQQQTTDAANANQASTSATGSGSQAVVSTDDANNQVATGSPWSGTRTFTRTVWLPHRIDSNAVKAKLDHGVLTVTATKAKDEAVKISVE